MYKVVLKTQVSGHPDYRSTTLTGCVKFFKGETPYSFTGKAIDYVVICESSNEWIDGSRCTEVDLLRRSRSFTLIQDFSAQKVPQIPISARESDTPSAMHEIHYISLYRGDTVQGVYDGGINVSCCVEHQNSLYLIDIPRHLLTQK